MEDQLGARVAFDVLVEADFVVSGRDRCTDRYSEDADWFKVSCTGVSCTGDLSLNLDGFTITGTEEYSVRGKQHNFVSDALMSAVCKEHLADVEKGLRRHYPCLFIGSAAVNLYRVAKRRGRTKNP